MDALENELGASIEDIDTEHAVPQYFEVEPDMLNGETRMLFQPKEEDTDRKDDDPITLVIEEIENNYTCLLYTSPSPRDS